MMHAACPHKVD